MTSGCEQQAPCRLRAYPFEVKSVQAIDPNDHGSLKQHVSAHQPFVSKGLVDSWPLQRKIAGSLTVQERIDEFENLLDDLDIRFTYTPAEQKGDIGIGPDLNPNFRMDERIASGPEFLALVSRLVHEPTGECAYAAALPLADLPDVSSQLTSLDSIGGAKPSQTNLWIGSGDHVVDLHFDGMRNLISMIAGVKRVTIFPPEALPHIYPAPLHRRVAGVTRSLVKLLDADLEEHPRFTSALQYAQVVTLNPGDTLFIPPLWWHHVESYGFNVMVNAWYECLPERSRKDFQEARALFLKNLARFSKSDETTLAGYSRMFASLGPAEERTGEVSFDRQSTKWTKRRLRQLKRDIDLIRDSIDGLPDYWAAYLKVMYKYYVFREYGDPYPTLPGMLKEVANSIRTDFWGRVRRRGFALLRRLSSAKR